MNGTTVVVVGDEPASVLQATEFFEAAGLTVRGYDHGDRALDYLLSNQTEVAAVFTDLVLPSPTDGVARARAVAAACPFIAIVVTAAATSDRPDALSACARFLPQPWNPLDVINAILDAHQES